VSNVSEEQVLEPLFESNEVAVETAAPVLMPGAQLRASREAQSISIGEVSHALKFSVRQLEALESDDFSSLKGATFIRGFVRSYARFLRLDEAPLLAALESQAPAMIADVQAVEHMGAAMPVTGQTSMLRPILMLLVIVAGAAAAWLFLSDNPDLGIKFTPKDSVVKAPVAAPATNTEAPATTAVTTSAQPTPEVLTAAPTTPASDPGTVATAAVPAPNPDERSLVFSFNDSSWVEVRDAKQRVIFTGKYPGNTQQSVRGRPPFQLVIGNAAMVKLRYEDRNIDLQPYIRAEVARLTLDDNSN
jgi:cytoskeleton protein RodZ